MDQHKKQQLIYGRRVWNLLHSTAAYYPEEPSEDHKQNARDFLEQFMDIGIDYEDWGKKFLKRMREDGDNPLDVSDRKEFSQWMCRHHNLVNKELGKSEYDCSYENLKERWGGPAK